MYYIFSRVQKWCGSVHNVCGSDTWNNLHPTALLFTSVDAGPLTAGRPPELFWVSRVSSARPFPTGCWRLYHCCRRPSSFAPEATSAAQARQCYFWSAGHCCFRWALQLHCCGRPSVHICLSSCAMEPKTSFKDGNTKSALPGSCYSSATAHHPSPFELSEKFDEVKENMIPYPLCGGRRGVHGSESWVTNNIVFS